MSLITDIRDARFNFNVKLEFEVNKLFGLNIIRLLRISEQK